MSSNGCSEKETAEKSSVLQDIESQAPVTSIDRVPAFQDNEKDGKPEDPTLVRIHPACFDPTLKRTRY